MVPTVLKNLFSSFQYYLFFLRHLFFIPVPILHFRKKYVFFQYLWYKKNQLKKFTSDLEEFYNKDGEYDKRCLKNINRQIDSILKAIELYEECKVKVYYRHYKNYNAFLENSDPFKIAAIFDNEFEILLYKIIAAKLLSLKWHFQSDIFEIFLFLFLSYGKIFSSKTSTAFRAHSTDDKELSLNNLEIIQTDMYAFFVYEQKTTFLKYIQYFQRRLEHLKRVLMKNKKRDQNEILSPHSLDHIEEFREKITSNYIINNYWLLRDIESLEYIQSYLNIVQDVFSVKNNNAQLGKLVLERALQVTGEYIKNSTDSPFLSNESRSTLQGLNVPLQEFQLLRNSLSHSPTLGSKLKLEENHNDAFVKIQEDFAKLNQVISYLLSIVKQNKLSWQFENTVRYVSKISRKLKKTYKIKQQQELIGSALVRLLNTFIVLSRTNNYGFTNIQTFNSFLKKVEAPHYKISECAAKRFSTLKNILHIDLLENTKSGEYLNYDEFEKKYSRKNKNIMYPYFSKDRARQAAVEVILLDLMSIITDGPLREFNLASGHLDKGYNDFVFGIWSDSSLRNYLAHGPNTRRIEYNWSKRINSTILNLLAEEKYIIVLLQLVEDKEIIDILFDAMSSKSELNNTESISCILDAVNEGDTIDAYRDFISIIGKSSVYSKYLLEVARLSNDTFSFVRKGDHKKVAESLEKKSVKNINASDNLGKPLLYYAVMLSSSKNGGVKSSLKMIDLLLKHNAKFDEPTLLYLKNNIELFREVLNRTITAGDLENFQALSSMLENINDVVNLKTEHNLLHTCAKCGKQELVVYLLSIKDIEIRKTDKFGFTCLHYAAQRGLTQVVEQVLQKAKELRVVISKIDFTLEWLKTRVKNVTPDNPKELTTIDNYNRIIKLLEDFT